ncbi:MAG: galactokinase family protein [Planctomycetaceae bacterium]
MLHRRPEPERAGCWRAASPKPYRPQIRRGTSGEASGPRSRAKPDEGFRQARGAARVASVPGRLHLLGEHLDRQCGTVLPVAIARSGGRLPGALRIATAGGVRRSWARLASRRRDVPRPRRADAPDSRRAKSLF